ncbi:MAG: hypothetical protein ABIQ39_17075 [Ilumatobacteraceae bacterium]
MRDKDPIARDDKSSATSRATRNDAGSVGEMIQLVKDYARQETVGPLRGAGRWLAYGAAGAVLIGLASAFLVLGVLRLLQTEFARTFRGQWMQVLPYVIAAAVAVVIIGVAISRIGKKSLQKEQS